jgi:hypothetical protein
MAAGYRAGNGSVHFFDRFRFASPLQASGNVFDLGGWETPGGAEKNSAASFFDREFGAGSPGVRSPDFLGQHDLALGGELGSLHW